MLKQKQIIQQEQQQLKPEQQFILKRQIKKKEAQMLIFLYNVDFQLTFEKFDEKIALYTELKRYQKKVTLKNDQIKRQFYALSQKLHQKILREDAQCQKELNKLQTYWENKKIEYFHRYFVQKYVYSTYFKNFSTLIKNQQHLIKYEQHIYYSILKTIWARQICLGQIQKQLKALEPSNMYEHFHIVKQRQIERNRRMQQKNYKIHGFRAKLRLDEKQINLNKTRIEKLFQMIQNYRKLTYHLIQLIRNWKLYLLSLTHDNKLRKQQLSFYHQEHNILLILLNDTNFITTSFLSNFYTFSLKNDPFLLKPIFYFEKKEEINRLLTPEERQLKKLIHIKPQYLCNIISAIRELYYEVLSYSNNNRLFQKHSHNKIQHIQSQKLLILNGEDLKQSKEQNLSRIKNTMKRYQSQSYQKNNSSFHKQHSQSKRNDSVEKQTNLNKYKSQKLLLMPIKQYRQSQKDNHDSLLKNKSSIIARKETPQIMGLSTFYRPKSKKSNPQEKLLQFDEIKRLKQQVYKKVKDQFQYETKKKLLQNEKFHQMIDEQIRTKMNKIIQQDKERILNQQLQITPLSFSEQEIKSYIAYAYKQIPSLFGEMQIGQNDLMKKISEISYCYILKVHNKFGEISNVIATINREITDYKSIEVDLISFRYKQTLQKIILKVIQFFWKYQNCKEIIINFISSPIKSDQKELINLLKTKLALNCNIIDKNHKNYSTHKFIFIRNHLQSKILFNPFPEQIFFQLYAIVSIQPLELTLHNNHNIQNRLYYDFVVLQILRKYTNSEDFLSLRTQFTNKDRFWHLINQIMIVQDVQNQKVKVQSLYAETIGELNYKLRMAKKPTLQVTDINTFNNIRMIQIQYSLTIAFQLKILANDNGQKYHRYAIRNYVEYMINEEETQFYKLPVKELQHLKIIIFSAQNYFKYHSLGLNMYLLETLEQNKKKWGKKYIENLWIEMLRFPSNGTQRQQHYLNTSRCHDFRSIGKDLLIGDRFDWYTDIQIQNGIQYRFKQGDINLKKPLGIGVITNKNILIYARILGEQRSN